MRIHLRLLLPVLTGVLVAAGFLFVAVAIDEAVRGALTTIPGLTRERAAEEAVRVVVLGGVLVTALAVAATYLLARAIVRPLAALERTARHLTQTADVTQPETPLAEIRSLAGGLRRAADEVRDRHGAAVREGSELAALVEAVSEGIVQVDGSGRVARANRASRDLLGMPRDAIGRPVASLVRSSELRELMDRGAAGEPVGAIEVALDERSILVSVSPRPHGGVLMTMVDLTDLRRLEEVRRDFVANASHELKTPLTSIRGYSETLLRGDVEGPERHRFLETIARNAERLHRVVDDLLDLSRLEADRWELELEPLDLLDVAASSWAAIADRAPAPALHFETIPHGDDRIMADRRALEQVFANLYDNALRHTPDGGAVTVSVQPDTDCPGTTPRGREWVRVEVADTGTGIPRDALPRIFERFYRVDPARSRAEGGTGLGLSIVKHLMEAMGGAVRAESTLGKGTTLLLWLPAVEAEAQGEVPKVE